MHVLFLTDNFPPEVNAPASRTFEHCREWVKAGHRVTVITCAPNFPTGKVFPGYHNHPWSRETLEGVEVVRVWSYITANEGFLKRVLDYQSFMATATLASLGVREVDVIVGTSPQFFTACAAYLVSRVKGRPWVFELRDLWPESIKAVGALPAGPLLSLLEQLELFLYQRADAIVAVTEAFRRDLIERGIDPDKIVVVTNGADLSRFKPRPKDPALLAQLDLQDAFVAGYIGTHGMAHALETLLSAAALAPRGVVFLFLGDGARKQALRDQAQALGLTNVRFVDSVPKEAVAAYWSILDVSVIHLRKTELFTTVIPSKLFESLAMGLPVLLGVEGESAEIVRTEGAGLCFEPENAEALAEALLRLQEHPDQLQRFREACLAAARRYDRTHLAAKMLRVLERVAAAPAKARRASPADWRPWGGLRRRPA